jgi:hypothetical protein
MSGISTVVPKTSWGDPQPAPCLPLLAAELSCRPPASSPPLLDRHAALPVTAAQAAGLCGWCRCLPLGLAAASRQSSLVVI